MFFSYLCVLGVFVMKLSSRATSKLGGVEGESPPRRERRDLLGGPSGPGSSAKTTLTYPNYLQPSQMVHMCYNHFRGIRVQREE